MAALGLLLLAAGYASAQVSSSADYHQQVSSLVSSDLASPGQDSGQYPNQYPNQGGYPGRGRYPRPSYGSEFGHVALEAGAGFTAPVGYTSNTFTYGYNVTLGGGWNFNRYLGLLAEYQFNRTGIQPAVLAAVGEPGGNEHVWSLTLDPVIYLNPREPVGAYVTGGGGFYRVLTSFTQPTLLYGTYCDYFSCYPYQYTANVVVAHNSSNQGGVNLGGGLTFGHRSKFYAEARYHWIDTPGRTTYLVPVTFGIRF